MEKLSTFCPPNGRHLNYSSIIASKPTRNSAARIWCYDYAPSLGREAKGMYAPRPASGLKNGMIQGAQKSIIILEDLDMKNDRLGWQYVQSAYHGF